MRKLHAALPLHASCAMGETAAARRGCTLAAQALSQTEWHSSVKRFARFRFSR
jgi:hypothetical protein